MNYESDNRRHVADYVQQCFDYVDHLDWVIRNVCIKYDTVRFIGLITLFFSLDFMQVYFNASCKSF